MDNKFEVWFCHCGRIHIFPTSDYDWMSEDPEHRRSMWVCRNCGNIYEHWLTRAFYEYNDKPAFDVNGTDYMNYDSLDIMEDPDIQRRYYFRVGIRVPIVEGGYADYLWSKLWCNTDYVNHKYHTTDLQWIKENHPECTTVDTERLIENIKKEYPYEADDILKCISRYISGINWKGTPYEHK